MSQDKPKNKAREWAQAVAQAAAEGKQIEVWDARPKNKAAQDLGSLGGRAGTGAAKRRSPEHYKRMVEARAEQRKAFVKEAEEINLSESLQVFQCGGQSATLTPKPDQDAR